ncbi:MAG TPA: glycosyltransferase [Thermoplasmata archaeon]|nr:glycosyltransferase [Thermoplasmata archaeon]
MRSRMEIAFYTDSYVPMQDGVAVVSAGLARALRRLGHGVRVFAPNPVVGRPTEEGEEDGIPVTRVRSLPVPLYGQYRWPLNPLALIREHRGAADADLLHLHTPGGIGSAGFLAARRFDRPLVGTFHTNLKEMRESVPQKFLVPTFFRIAWWYNLGTYWRCDVATAPSRAAREALEEAVRKPFRRPVEVVPNGVDVDRFRPGLSVPDWRERCGLPRDPLVTYLGRLTVDKGVHRFLDALAAAAGATDLVGVVGGAGPEAGAVRDRIRADPRLAGRVRYVGPVAEVEKPSLLSQTDLFVLPSTSDTSSIALLEAMASGVAVVAPAAGGAAEVVADGVTGRRVPVLEAGALSAAVRDLLDDPARREAMGRAAAEEVRRTASLDTMARRFISLYELAIAARGRGERRSAVRA